MKYGLKHRIIGAIILLSLAVIFLPMLLDGGERPYLAHTTSPIPAPPPKPEIKVQQPKPAGKPVSQVETAPEREQWEAGLTERHTLASWTLQAATFSDRSNAVQLRDRIRDEKIRAYVRERPPYFVVYAGPFADPKQAKKTRSRLKTQFSIEALLMNYDPMADVR